MKKPIIASVLFVVVLGVILSCNSNRNVNSNPLVGKWQKANVDSVRFVLEVTADNAWNYYKNDSLLEKGSLEIINDKFIMKHAEEAHNETTQHEHNKPDNHEYKFSLNADKTELSIISETKTSIYKKVQ